MMIYYECSGCRAVLESPAELVGKPDRCPDCGAVNVVPRQSLPWQRKAPRTPKPKAQAKRKPTPTTTPTPQKAPGGFGSGWVYGLGFAVGLLTMLQLSGVFDSRSRRASKPRATKTAVSTVAQRHQAVGPSSRGSAVRATGPEAKALAEAKAFVKRGGDLNRDYAKGLTALHWAARHGYVEVAKFLIDSGADVNAKEKAVSRATPLHMAAVYSHVAVAKLLLARGASVDSADQYGSTPLQYAAFNGHDELISLFLEKGADINHRERRYGITALHAATAGKRPKTVDLLIARGAEVNVRNHAGETPLGTALRTGQSAIAAALRPHGGKQ